MTGRAAAVALVAALCLATVPTRAAGADLPDHRAYELVSNIGEDESALNGAVPVFGAAASSGETVDWQAIGACCGAASGGINTFQSERTPGGWQTRVITPVPDEPLEGIGALQEAVFWGTNLSQVVYLTMGAFAPGDRRPKESGGSDLYLRTPSGALQWLSQGPAGSGTGPYSTTFETATPDAEAVVFSTAEPLTANATGLASHQESEYLYARQAQSETTSLIDVNGNGELLGPYGASAGDAGPPKESIFAIFGYRGTTTHSISEDGSKVFFETPPSGMTGLPEGVEPHLYMRDLANDTTTPLDDPAAAGSARYQGAAADGSLVFFTSDEGLDGTAEVNELYAFNTTAQPIGPVPPMSSIPIGAGAGVAGVTAVSNDGSRVYFVADAILATNVNSLGQGAVVNQPNLYVYSIDSGETQYITTLAMPDVSNCKPTCATGEPARLLARADVFRPSYTTPNGSTLVFTSSGDLTGEQHMSSTALSFEAAAGQRKITMASTAGLVRDRTIQIGSGEEEELPTIETVDSPTELTLAGGLVKARPAGTPVAAFFNEVFRFAVNGSLTCLSCTPPGVLETSSASLGEVPGGLFAAGIGHIAQMSEDGSRIFFDSPDPLLPDMAEAVTYRVFEPESVYEWENGKLYLIAAASNEGAAFDGTTPSGNDVFFQTRSALTPGAGVGFRHLYDARVDGGFPERGPPVDPCAEQICRPPGASPPSSSTPASAAIGESGQTGMAPAPAPASAPTLTVTKITAAERVQLARTGKLVLRVGASTLGEVVASAFAPLRGKRTNVARASGVLGQRGELTLTLRLSEAARVELARRGALTLQIEVDDRLSGAQDAQLLSLHAADPRRLTAQGHRDG
jgi:hypothetical protein